MSNINDLKKRAGILTEEHFDPIENWINGNQSDVRRFIGNDPSKVAMFALSLWEQMGDEELRKFLTHISRV